MAQDPSLQALFAAVYGDPEDDAPRWVLADALQRLGDPRGEFIALQYQQEETARARSHALLVAHRGAWQPPELTRAGRVRWQRGFPDAVELRSLGNLRQLAGADVLRTLRHVELPAEIPADAVPLVERFLEDPALVSLRSVDGLDLRMSLPTLGPRLEAVTFHAGPGETRDLVERGNRWQLDRVTLITRDPPEVVEAVAPEARVLQLIVERPNRDGQWVSLDRLCARAHPRQLRVALHGDGGALARLRVDGTFGAVQVGAWTDWEQLRRAGPVQTGSIPHLVVGRGTSLGGMGRLGWLQRLSLSPFAIGDLSELPPVQTLEIGSTPVVSEAVDLVDRLERAGCKLQEIEVGGMALRPDRTGRFTGATLEWATWRRAGHWDRDQLEAFATRVQTIQWSREALDKPRFADDYGSRLSTWIRRHPHIAWLGFS